ncbi:MAG: tRNA-dihydrouridine synthase family protein [Phycisphaerae bacterium]|jgi:nifR3 family TIM-barrel protein
MTVTLKPFRIGGIQVDFPIILAPLAGFTDLSYRLLCRRFGAPYCTTEMMLDKQMLLTGKLRRRLTRLDELDHPVAGQLIGNDPAMMAGAAAIVCQEGFDVVDLNFACPVHKALRRRRGGFLMSQADHAVAIARAVTAVATKPVTLKVRRKYRTADEDDMFWRIAEGVFEAGVAAITVHARSVEMKYVGRADWDFLTEVKRRFPDRTIIGSGDVLTPAAALDMLAQTGVDAVAVARGAMGNPWFFRQAADLAAGREISKPPISEQREALAWHFDHAVGLYGQKTSKIMRKFGIKYARMHPMPGKVRTAFINVKNAGDWHAVLEQYYQG